MAAVLTEGTTASALWERDTGRNRNGERAVQCNILKDLPAPRAGRGRKQVMKETNRPDQVIVVISRVQVAPCSEKSRLSKRERAGCVLV